MTGPTVGPASTQVGRQRRLVLLIVGAFLGDMIAGELGLGLGIVIGALIAWFWWSLAIPRWRAWALARGADSVGLLRFGVMTGLVWPKGSLLERTERPPRDRDTSEDGVS